MFDALGDRLWVDHEETELFVNNIETCYPPAALTAVPAANGHASGSGPPSVSTETALSATAPAAATTPRQMAAINIADDDDGEWEEMEMDVSTIAPVVVTAPEAVLLVRPRYPEG